MNQNITNQRSRAGRMKNFFAAKNAFIGPHADINDAISDFNINLTEFDTFAERQQSPITGYAEGKRVALEAAAEIVSKWGVRCHVKAEESNMPVLAELLNHTYPQLIGMEDTEGLNMMKDIRNGLNDNMALFAPQGLLPLVITEIDTNINFYDALINKPAEAISGRKMETEALEILMNGINEELKAIVSLLESIWTPDKEELIIEMKNNYKIYDLGHRYTGIEGKVAVGTLGDVENYKIVAVKDGGDYSKQAVTNLIGEYKIQSMKPGIYRFKVIDPAGVVVKTEIITIESGVTLDVNWTV